VQPTQAVQYNNLQRSSYKPVDGPVWPKHVAPFTWKQELAIDLTYIYNIICEVTDNFIAYTWTDNEVRELATVCLRWQQWTETSVWCDDVGKSAFHSFVVVDLWQSLSDWRLLLFECVLVNLVYRAKKQILYVNCCVVSLFNFHITTTVIFRVNKRIN
jgi:hypothetical protein